MKLHNYYLSSASFRVRIALNLKGLPYEYLSHHLRRSEHRSPEFLALNPQGLVPALELDDGAVLTQSMAIIEYLEEAHPEPALLPHGLRERARVRALAQAIACDIHPINNLRVLKYLESPLGHEQEARDTWYRHWVTVGFDGLETELAGSPATGRFCHGDTPTLADVCLLPQVFNAQRFNTDLTPYPTIRRIAAECMTLPAFADAAPEKQPEAQAQT
ncbi:MAG TPA: maleylacetoacetate isomerase [Azospirillum sp.]|nr:maleylacetoacetate isomerase [Azospirillum sp.]